MTHWQDRTGYAIASKMNTLEIAGYFRSHAVWRPWKQQWKQQQSEGLCESCNVEAMRATTANNGKWKFPKRRRSRGCWEVYFCDICCERMRGGSRIQQMADTHKSFLMGWPSAKTRVRSLRVQRKTNIILFFSHTSRNTNLKRRNTFFAVDLVLIEFTAHLDAVG